MELRFAIICKFTDLDIHNDPDGFVSIGEAMNLVYKMNLFNTAIPPRVTIFPAFGLYGHDAWSKATDPGYGEDGKNVYEWMLQYSR